jgi:hypothetical protein
MGRPSLEKVVQHLVMQNLTLEGNSKDSMQLQGSAKAKEGMDTLGMVR